MLAGRAEAIWATRDRKLETARARRRALSRQAIEKTASQDVRRSTIVHSPKPNPLSESPIAVH
ncbi:MAG: hypothetical protein ABIP09_04865 [Gemmatimonadaceae bacterium]